MENERSNIGKKAGIIGIAANLVLVIIKLIAGLLSSSVSIMADAFNNLSDATSSIVTLVGFRLSELPPDSEHPYGHARFEYLSGLVVAMLILVIGFEMALGSVKKIINPQETQASLLIFYILIVSIFMKAALWIYYKRKGQEISSSVLLASSADSKNDVITTTAVLCSLCVENYFHLKIDGFMGLAVAIFILYSGVLLAKETVSPLLGEGVNEELKILLEDYILSGEKVAGCHDLMVHDYGPGKRFASIHVEMDKEEDSITCHEIIDKMERECFEKYGVHLVIHYDPIVTDDPELERLHGIVSSILHMKDTRLSMHDFRMTLGEENINLIFDIVLPPELRGQEKEIQNSLEKALNSIENKRYFTVITFDIGFNR
ncbi:MAG: cation transporter [Lachnospiraceae bacterium]|nr:cation transporter [Lachnospiraceae bacterium]